MVANNHSSNPDRPLKSLYSGGKEKEKESSQIKIDCVAVSFVQNNLIQDQGQPPKKS